MFCQRTKLIVVGLNPLKPRNRKSTHVVTRVVPKRCVKKKSNCFPERDFKLLCNIMDIFLFDDKERIVVIFE